MAYITKFGSFWGMLPQTTGRTFWVAPADSYTVEGRTYSASDANQGLSPENAFRTVDYAVGQTTANVGDVIVLLPGSHTGAQTADAGLALVTLDVAGIVITGIPGDIPHTGSRRNSGPRRLRTRITNSTAAGIIFRVSAADIEIAHLDIDPPAGGGRGVQVDLAGSDFYIHDCSISMIATAAITTYGITSPLASPGVNVDNILVRNCYFQSGLVGSTGANGAAVFMGATVRGMAIENSTFELKGTAAWADAILSTGTASVGITIRDCDFITPVSATTVMTDVIDTTGAVLDGSCTVLRCYFPNGSDAFQITATPDIEASECYTSVSTAASMVAIGVA